MNVWSAGPWLLLALAAPVLRFTSPAELVAPGIVSTAGSEIRLAVSPDGRTRVWGCIARAGGPGGLDLWESHRVRGGWSAPAPLPFDTPANEFDPSFTPDGRTLLFFSNRDGGLGGDDLYAVTFDPAAARWGEPRGLGPGLNTAGDEWAPVVSPDGTRLMFASDGRGGRGAHDLFVAPRAGDGWGAPVALDALNGPDEDFDAAFLSDGRGVVFTRRAKDQDGADLWVAPWDRDHLAAPVRLGAEVNADSAWNLGPSIDPREHGVLYFSSHHAAPSAGRTDLYRIRYRIVAGAARGARSTQ